jgi:hypothetical protein
MTAFQYQQLIKKYVRKHKIKIVGYFNDSQGEANLETREIKIPYPVIEVNFYICLHEIGHIITNELSDSDLVGEYKATEYGVTEAKKCGVVFSKEVMECIRCYLKYYLVKAINSGVTAESIPGKVYRLAGANKQYWVKMCKAGKKPDGNVSNVDGEFQRFRAYKVKWNS